MFFANILAILGLFVSFLAAFISPEKLWILGIFGLAYPILLLLNAAFIVFWLIQFKRLFLLSTIAICIGFFDLKNTFPIHFTKPTPHNADGHLIKLMSYNVRLFDLYNWSHNVESRMNFLEFLRKEQPKIVCFQEYYSEGAKGHLHNTDTLKKYLEAKNQHIEYIDHFGDDGNMGSATFSVYPIVGKGRINFNEPTNNSCIFTDLHIGEDTIRVYNIHLQSIRFQQEDYDFVENVKKNHENTAEINGSKKLLRRLKIAFIKRAKQVDILHDHINKSPHPVIICGDFNDSPSSYSYHIIKNTLKDAFVENATGMGNTYNGVFPSFRIDYILHDASFHSYFFKIHRKKMSDHYPITCAIDIKTTKKHD